MTPTTTTDKPTYPCPLPASSEYAPFSATDAIRAMNATGRTEMIHYAGAAHRDRTDWHVTRAWLDQPTRTESECKSIALWRAWGSTLTPEQIRAANPGMR